MIICYTFIALGRKPDDEMLTLTAESSHLQELYLFNDGKDVYEELTGVTQSQ